MRLFADMGDSDEDILAMDMHQQMREQFGTNMEV